MIMKRKIVFGVFLLLASSSAVTWTKVDDNQAQEIKKSRKKAEKTVWEKVKEQCPSTREALWCCAGAVYPLLRITHDSTPTLGQYSKMALRRGLWGYGAWCGINGLVGICLNGTFKERMARVAGGFLVPVLHENKALFNSMFLTHAACRGLLCPLDSMIPQLLGVVFYELSGYESTDLCSENYNWFLRGSLVSSLLGIGIRYRKDFAGGFRQAPLLIKQLPVFVKTLSTWLPFFTGKKLASSIG